MQYHGNGFTHNERLWRNRNLCWMLSSKFEKYIWTFLFCTKSRKFILKYAKSFTKINWKILYIILIKFIGFFLGFASVRTLMELQRKRFDWKMQKSSHTCLQNLRHGQWRFVLFWIQIINYVNIYTMGPKKFNSGQKKSWNQIKSISRIFFLNISHKN